MDTSIRFSNLLVLRVRMTFLEEYVCFYELIYHHHTELIGVMMWLDYTETEKICYFKVHRMPIFNMIRFTLAILFRKQKKKSNVKMQKHTSHFAQSKFKIDSTLKLVFSESLPLAVKYLLTKVIIPFPFHLYFSIVGPLPWIFVLPKMFV